MLFCPLVDKNMKRRMNVQLEMNYFIMFASAQLSWYTVFDIMWQFSATLIRWFEHVFWGVEKKVCVLFERERENYLDLGVELLMNWILFIKKAERRGHSASSAPCLLLCYTLSRTQNHPNIAQTKPMFKFLIGLKQWRTECSSGSQWTWDSVQRNQAWTLVLYGRPWVQNYLAQKINVSLNGHSFYWKSILCPQNT